MEVSTDDYGPVRGGSIRWMAVTLVRNIKWTSLIFLATILISLPVGLLAVAIPIRWAWTAYVAFVLFFGIKASTLFVRHHVTFEPPTFDTPGRDGLIINDTKMGEWRELIPLILGGMTSLGTIIVGISVLASTFMTPYAAIFGPFIGLVIEAKISRTYDKTFAAPGVKLVGKLIGRLRSHTSQERMVHNQRVEYALAIIELSVGGGLDQYYGNSQ